MFREANRVTILKGGNESLAPSVVEGRKTILVVDDEPDMRRFLVSALTEEYSVLQAADGESGFETALKSKPDLVVLDLMLPGISGMEVCKKFRSQPELARLKVLMLTARIDENSKIEALENGVDDFLTKPFSTIEVKTRIRNLLTAAHLEEDLRSSNRDLTETLDLLKSAEAQLVQSAKMTAIGSLAAGLLHEINNPLNFTMMALSTLPRAGEDAETKETLADIDAGMKRIRDIVTDLRDFAYPEPAGRQSEFSIREAVETALRFTAQEVNCAEVDTTGVNGERVMGSRTHITQVLVNMLTNAAHAVKASQGERSPAIRVRTESKSNRLVIHVWDNGAGIAPENLGRIFDPFFTTKDVGKGTGLGLSICHTIVRNHGGQIQVESQAGSHTEFSFDIPLSV
jgi:C4-dicarboxylate-specific signal transduction histidine kinase